MRCHYVYVYKSHSSISFSILNWDTWNTHIQYFFVIYKIIFQLHSVCRSSECKKWILTKHFFCILMLLLLMPLVFIYMQMRNGYWIENCTLAEKWNDTMHFVVDRYWYWTIYWEAFLVEIKWNVESLSR